MPRPLFRSESRRKRLIDRYDRLLGLWPATHRAFYVQTSFGVTHVVASGPEQGRPVLLLHPSHSNSALWAGCIQELSWNHRVFAVDIIGDAGKSEPSADLPPGFDRPWLLQVMDGLFIDRVDVVAVSRACQIAINLAGYVPQRIGRLVLVSGSLNGMSPTPELSRRLRAARLFPTAVNVHRLLSLIAPTANGENRLVGYQAEILEACRVPSYRVYDPSQFGGDSSLPEAETLLMLGEREAMFDARKAADLGSGRFPHLTVHWVPEVGHLMTIERPRMVGRRILEFLEA